MKHRLLFVLAAGWLCGATILALAAAPSPAATAPLPQALTPTPTGDRTLKAQADQFLQDGIALAQKQDWTGALAQFNKARDLYRQANDPAGEGKTLNNIGQVYWNTDAKQALDYFTQALPLIQSLNDHTLEISVLGSIGAIYQNDPQLQDYHQALDYYRQAEQLAHTSQDKREAVILQALGLIYDALGQTQQAIDSYQQALPLLHAAQDATQEESTLEVLGLDYSSQGTYAQALGTYSQTLPLLTAPAQSSKRAAVLRLMGDATGNLGQPDDALRYYNQALSAAQEAQDPDREADIYGALGTFYSGVVEDWQQAINDYQKALAIWQAQQGPHAQAQQGRTLVSIGFIYYLMGDKEHIANYQQARERYTQAQPLLQAAGTVDDQATVLMKLGDVARLLGDNPAAIQSYQQALTLWQAAQKPVETVNTLRTLAFTYGLSGDKQQAQAYLRQLLPLSQTITDPAYQPVILSSIGLVYQTLDQVDKAREYYNRALQGFKTLDDKLAQGDALDSIGTTYESQGNLTQALDYYQQAITAVEQVRVAAQLDALRTGIAGRASNMYQHAILAAIRLKENTLAFNLSERARARTLLDQLGNGPLDIRVGADTQLLQQEHTLGAQIDTLDQRIRGGENTVALRDQRTQLQQEYQELLTQIQQSNPKYAALRSVNPLTLPEIQQLLDADTTLLSYYLTPNETLAFIVTRDHDLVVQELPVGAEEVRSDVTSLQSSSDSVTVPPEMGKLYAALLAPLQDHLTTPVVGIIPHDMLHYLPFAALGNGQQYFGDQHILFVLPSASAYRYILAERKSAPNGAALVLGYSQAPGFSLLGAADQEAQTIASLYGTHPLLDDAATETALRAGAGNARILHLAAHGELNGASPLFSRIVLAPDRTNDGSLAVHEVYGLDLRQADLVVLSACESQLGAASRGDDWVGLSQAFIYAGTPSVIASLRVVKDAATASLMENFYRHLQGGMSKGAALQAAEQETRRQYPQMWDWAAFVLLGDPGTTGTPNTGGTGVDSSLPWLAGLGGGAILAGGLVLVVRMRRMRRR